jgi:hypothetical protein
MNKFFEEHIILPKFHILNERFDEIHREFITNLDKLTWFNWGAEAGYYAQNDISYKHWKVAPLYGLKDDILKENSIDRLQHLKDFITVENDLIKTSNTTTLPILTQSLLDAGIKKRVGISVISPGKEIPWHSDPDPENPNKHIIRGLCGIDIKEEDDKESFIYLDSNNQKKVFKNKEFVFFWGRIPHKVENNLSTPRYAICFDVEINREKLLNT